MSASGNRRVTQAQGIKFSGAHMLLVLVHLPSKFGTQFKYIVCSWFLCPALQHGYLRNAKKRTKPARN
jgi:hypothetical protein